MNHRLPLALLASALLALAAAHAQSDDDDDDQDFDYFAYFTRAHSNLKFGFRATQGAKVNFGNLGSIPAAALADLSATEPTRTYANGSVSSDGPRPNEFDAAGNPVATSGGRYQVMGGESDANGVPTIGVDGSQVQTVTSDDVAYVSGYTRNYSINSATQVVGGSVVMTQYSAVSEGAGFAGKRNISGGVELQVERLFTNPAKRFRFSLVGGVSLNGINSKKSGTVSSTLHIVSDSYSLLNGTALPATAVFPYATPDFGSGTGVDSAGNSVTFPQELTVPLSITPTSAVTDVADGAEVTGVWEIKGSYVVIRFGPELSASLTPNLSFNASAGFAAAYVGTNYTAIETATLTDPTLISDTITTGALTNAVSKFLPGYYANLDTSWAVNERTGFYAGLSYESYGDFDQTLEGRTAKIDLGGNASLRGGINIKF